MRWAAAELGQEVLYDEELTDAEVAEELLPITVQLGYVTACSGHTGASAPLAALEEGQFCKYRLRVGGSGCCDSIAVCARGLYAL
jgi:hypothetical protein